MLKESEPRLLVESVLLGIVGALTAQVFMWVLRGCQYLFLILLAGYHPPGLPEEGGILRQVIGPHGLWLIPISTTLGGLLSGLLVYHFAPEAEGHGTDTVVKAFHRTGGFIRARVAPLKLVASAITIGSGGAAGREGPIALIGAGIGSTYATVGHRPEEQRRILALVGMAAGLSAVFRSPIGAAFFATEVLYGSVEFESSALLYTMLAAITAYATNGFFVGWGPLFYFKLNQRPLAALDYAWLGVLGAAAGLVATILPVAFYRIRDLFRALPFSRALNPAIGGLGLGIMAVWFPQVLGGGYGWIQQAIDGKMVLHLLIILLFAKILAFTFTVSSGGSGGVFAPTLFVGAMVGGLFASVSHLPSDMFVVLGMAGTFGAAARVPIASLMMVTEMTGEYRLLPPAAFVVLLGYLIQSRLSAHLKYTSLYEAQVEGRGQSPARYQESIQLALSLLGTRGISQAVHLGHLDLVALLDTGIPIQLPGRRHLHVGVLHPGNKLAGQTVQSCYDAAGNGTLEIVAILRGGDLVLPDSTTVLQESDRVLVIASTEAQSKIAEHFAPASSRDGASSPSQHATDSQNAMNSRNSKISPPHP